VVWEDGGRKAPSYPILAWGIAVNSCYGPVSHCQLPEIVVNFEELKPGAGML
jgi:hypothetical protein